MDNISRVTPKELAEGMQAGWVLYEHSVKASGREVSDEEKQAWFNAAGSVSGIFESRQLPAEVKAFVDFSRLQMKMLHERNGVAFIRLDLPEDAKEFGLSLEDRIIVRTPYGEIKLSVDQDGEILVEAGDWQTFNVAAFPGRGTHSMYLRAVPYKEVSK